MATNKQLRANLLKKLGVTPQRLSQRVAQIKRLYGPMTTEEGTYVLAHREGMDLSKYLEPQLVDRIRSMIPAGVKVLPSRKGIRGQRRPSRAQPIRIGPRLENVDAMLSSSIADDANKMAQIYPYLYVLENSLRIVILRFLSSAHGKDWWEQCVPKDIQKAVDSRKTSEKKKPWHGKRGAHEIFYSDFGDLRRIIEKNWPKFQSLFPSRPWITQKLDELEPPRNVLAHHNPISQTEEGRIKLYFEDWIALLNDRRDLIP